MVTCKLYGRLGNQMSQIAATIGYAVKHNMSYHIPALSERPADWPCYFPHLVNEGPQYGGIYTYKEPSQAYHEIPYYPNICLDGHFPSELYWKHCSKHIARAFNIPWENRFGVVGVHVRRGDYLKFPDVHPIVSEDYLLEAMRFFIKDGFTHFLFFSDDIEWCRNFSDQASDKLKIHRSMLTMRIDSPHSAPLDSIAQLSNCHHQIISNSTFGLWAAHLNQNPDKIVVAPKTWTNVSTEVWDTSEICPESWIRL
jgi:hypothetical protein